VLKVPLFVKTLEYSRQTSVNYNQTATVQVLTAVLKIEVLLEADVESTGEHTDVSKDTVICLLACVYLLFNVGEGALTRGHDSSQGT
jgi:hypothetical protein